MTTPAPHVEAVAEPEQAGFEGADRSEQMGSAPPASNRTPVSASRLEERDTHGALALEVLFGQEQPFQTSWIVHSPGGGTHEIDSQPAAPSLIGGLDVDTDWIVECWAGPQQARRAQLASRSVRLVPGETTEVSVEIDPSTSNVADLELIVVHPEGFDPERTALTLRPEIPGLGSISLAGAVWLEVDESTTRSFLRQFAAGIWHLESQEYGELAVFHVGTRGTETLLIDLSSLVRVDVLVRDGQGQAVRHPRLAIHGPDHAIRRITTSSGFRFSPFEQNASEGVVTFWSWPGVFEMEVAASGHDTAHRLLESVPPRTKLEVELESRSTYLHRVELFDAEGPVALPLEDWVACSAHSADALGKLEKIEFALGKANDLGVASSNEATLHFDRPGRYFLEIPPTWGSPTSWIDIEVSDQVDTTPVPVVLSPVAR